MEVHEIDGILVVDRNPFGKGGPGSGRYPAGSGGGRGGAGSGGGGTLFAPEISALQRGGYKMHGDTATKQSKDGKADVDIDKNVGKGYRVRMSDNETDTTNTRNVTSLPEAIRIGDSFIESYDEDIEVGD